MMKHILFSLLFTVSVQGAAPSIGGSLSPAGVSVVITIKPGVTPTAGIQEAIDSLPKKTDIFSGTGGGTIVLGSGFFNCTTQIVIPNQGPFYLKLVGNGINNTYIRFKDGGTLTNKAFITAYTNAFNGMTLTNTLTLEMENLALMDDNRFKTNFIVNILGENFVRFFRIMFASSYALTNGNSAYTLNWEANVPNEPIGLVGLYVQDEGANSYCDIDSCIFYGLAGGAYLDNVVNRVRFNYFSCCGYFSDTVPPNNPIGIDPTKSHYATNLWQGNFDNADFGSTIAVGSALYVQTVDSLIEGNLFFGCGVCAFFDPAQSQDFGAGDGSYPHPNVEPYKFINNRYSVCKYRIATWDSGACAVVQDAMGSSGLVSFTGLTNFNDTVVDFNTHRVFVTGAFPTHPPLTYRGDSRYPAHIFYGGRVISTNGFQSCQSVATGSTGITFPNSTVLWTNTQLFNITLYINNSGITLSAIAKNGQQIFGSLANDVTLTLKPGDYFSETYTVGTPSARWEPQ